MIISSNCHAATTDTEEGCFPLSYVIIAAACLAFLILVVGAHVWRGHVTDRRAHKQRDQNIDLEDQAFDSRPDLQRENTDISRPPSYRSTEDTLVVPAPYETATPAYEVTNSKLGAPGQGTMSSGSTKGRKERPKLTINIPSTPQTGVVLAQPDKASTLEVRQPSIDIGDGRNYPTAEHWRDSMDLSLEGLGPENEGLESDWKEKGRMRG